MADITDEQIAAAVRPLYADDTAASMGLADDIRTVRAVLALREQEASATGAATDDTLWKRRAYHLDRELKAARVDVDSEIVEGQLADFLLKFGGKYDGNGMWEVSLHLEEICQIMSALATPTTAPIGNAEEPAGFLAYQEGDEKPRFFPTMAVLTEGTKRWHPAVSRVVPLYASPPGEPVDVEQMLRDCVPGGCSVDPQPICDNIRAWFAGTTKSEGEV